MKAPHPYRYCCHAGNGIPGSTKFNGLVCNIDNWIYCLQFH